MTFQRLVFASLAVLWCAQPLLAQNAPPNAAPVAKAITATSLYRPDATWDVRTTIVLSVEDADSHQWTFSLLQPEALSLNGQSRLVCPDPGGSADSGLNKAIGQTTLLCYYSPKVDSDDEETFRYQAKDQENNLSQPAEVKISVKHGGLRWEFLTNGKTAVTSDNASSSALPDILGNTAQDFRFRLDWSVLNPKGRKDDELSLRQRIGTRVPHTSNAHFKFEMGFTTESQAAKTTPTTTPATTPAPAAGDPASETPNSVVQQRKFTAGGEFNYNAVFAPDQGGTFLEIGGLARGNLDAAIEDTTSGQTVGKQLVTVVRTGTGAGTFRGELAFRVALKQYSDEPLRTSVRRCEMMPTDTKSPETTVAPTRTCEQATFRRNSDNLMEFEFGYRRDTALDGLDVLKITENRYVLRVTAMPELPTPGHVRGTFGVELTGGFGAGSPKEVKILYGVGAGTLGLFPWK
jgi:hypothetical protein